MVAAENGGRWRTLQPGETIQLDHGITIEAIVVNAEDADGNVVDVHFAGRRDDCASNDFSIGLFVTYGDFRYLNAGDLTGNTSEGVAAVEALIEDDAADVDVYHVNHHGSATSSSIGLLRAMQPTVAIVSNGSEHEHPTRDVVRRILALDSRPDIYLTNRNPQSNAWNDDPDAIAPLRCMHGRWGYQTSTTNFALHEAWQPLPVEPGASFPLVLPCLSGGARS